MPRHRPCALGLVLTVSMLVPTLASAQWFGGPSQKKPDALSTPQPSVQAAAPLPSPESGPAPQRFGGPQQHKPQPARPSVPRPSSQAAAPLPSPGSPPAPNVEVPWNTTPPQPGSAQPRLPSAAPAWPEKPTSPVIERIVREKQAPLLVRKRAAGPIVVRQPRRYAGRRYRGRLLERPALAGVVLVAPLPRPPEGPHLEVPMPAYPVESFVARYTTPPPPVRCHPAWRDPYAPDAHLYKEVPVLCEPEED